MAEKIEIIPNPVGRPRIEIDYEQTEKLSSILCTQAEIAAVIGVSLSTLEHDQKFLRIHQKGLEIGRASVRRMQYKSAEGGNPTMLIWLGKQYLDQKDQKNTEISTPEGKFIVIDIEARMKKYDHLFSPSGTVPADDSGK